MCLQCYLQYTLLLLIQAVAQQRQPGSSPFTIHFATINTGMENIWRRFKIIFTIHFATINTAENNPQGMLYALFTIHFATINTNL